MGRLTSQPERVHAASLDGGFELRSVIDHFPFGVVLIDRMADATFANQAWTDLTGQHARLWSGEGWLRVLGPAERGPARHQLVNAVGHHQGLETDWVVHDASSARRFLRLQLTPDRDASGAPGGIVTIQDVTKERQRVEQLVELATHDPLTGLVNRHQLMEFLAHALSRYRRDPRLLIGLLFADIDDFKAVNDTFGHDTGDRLLRAAAEHLTVRVRPMDVVARFGGDEFVVLCEDLRSRDSVARITGRIRRSLLPVPGTPLHSTFSVGWTVLDDPDVDPETVIARADRSMYLHKRRRLT